MQCPRCGFEDTGLSAYCERCGTPLNVPQPISDQTEFSVPQIEYSQYSAPPPPPLNGHEAIPPPPPPPQYTEYSSHDMQSQIFSNQKVISRPTTSIFSAILYFMGALIAALGLMGMVTAIGTSAPVGGIALLLGTVLLIASIVIFIRIRRRFPHLRWWQRILWILAATVVGFIVLIIETILVHDPVVTNYVIGCVFMLYGIVWAAIAIW